MPTAAQTAHAAQPFETFAQANQKALTAATHFNARAMANMLRMQQHVLEFVSRRIERDVAAAEAFAKAADGPEIAALTQEFCAAAVSDYADESAELLRRATALANETLAAAKGDAER